MPGPPRGTDGAASQGIGGESDCDHGIWCGLGLGPSGHMQSRSYCRVITVKRVPLVQRSEMGLAGVVEFTDPRFVAWIRALSPDMPCSTA